MGLNSLGHDLWISVSYVTLFSLLLRLIYLRFGKIALIHMDIEKNNFPFVDINNEDFIPNTIDQGDVHKKNGELQSIHVDDQQTLSQ
jgi:hypothetical protein